MYRKDQRCTTVAHDEGGPWVKHTAIGDVRLAVSYRFGYAHLQFDLIPIDEAIGVDAQATGESEINPIGAH